MYSATARADFLNELSHIIFKTSEWALDPAPHLQEPVSPISRANFYEFQELY